MILDKEESEELTKFMEQVKGFILSTKKEKTNVGMKIWDESNEWLVKLYDTQK
jgi:hypothetical protein